MDVDDRIRMVTDEIGEKFSLTKRQREIFYYLSHGLSNLEIAKLLFIDEKTVKNHVSTILSKTETKTRNQLQALVANALAKLPDTIYAIDEPKQPRERIDELIQLLSKLNQDGIAGEGYEQVLRTLKVWWYDAGVLEHAG